MAMNEKFNKDEVWGELGGKGEKIEDEEDDYMDGNLEDDIPDVALINKVNSDAAKKVHFSFVVASGLIVQEPQSFHGNIGLCVNILL